MRFVRWILYIIVSFSVLSCTRCKVDEDYKQKFLSCIETLQKSHAGIKTQLIEIQEAVIFLSATTGIEPTNFDIEHGIYLDEGVITSDIAKWEAWYKENKCTMTLQYADSLVKKFE